MVSVPLAPGDTPRAIAARQRGGIVYLLGIYMLLKAVALTALGHYASAMGHTGLHGERHPSTAEERMERLDRLMSYVHLDPKGKVLGALLRRITDIEPRRLHWVAIASYFYAGLHLLEGIGLVGRWRWGEWVVVISTTALIPFEYWEYLHAHTGQQLLVRLCVIVVNCAIAGYFVYRLRIHAEKPVLHRDRRTTPAPQGP